MADTTKEVKLVISAVNNSDSALKSAATNLQNVSAAIAQARDALDSIRGKRTEISDAFTAGNLSVEAATTQLTSYINILTSASSALDNVGKHHSAYSGIIRSQLKNFNDTVNSLSQVAAKTGNVNAALTKVSSVVTEVNQKFADLRGVMTLQELAKAQKKVQDSTKGHSVAIAEWNARIDRAGRAVFNVREAIKNADITLQKIIVDFGTGNLTLDEAIVKLHEFANQTNTAQMELREFDFGVSKQSQELESIIDQYDEARSQIGLYGKEADIVKGLLDDFNRVAERASKVPPPGGGPPSGTDAGAWWDGNVKGAKETQEELKKTTEKFDVMGYSVRRLSSFAMRAFTAFPIAIVSVLSSLNQISKEAEKLGRRDVVNAITDMQRGLETSKQVILDIPIAGKSALDWAKEFATTISLSAKSLAAVLLLMRIRGAEEALAKAKGETSSALMAQGVRLRAGTPEEIALRQKELDEARAAGVLGGTDLVTGRPEDKIAAAKRLHDMQEIQRKSAEQTRANAVSAIDNLRSVVSPKLKALQQEYSDLKSQPGLSPEALQAATVAFDKMSKELSVPAPIVRELTNELGNLDRQLSLHLITLPQYNKAVADLVKRGQEWATQQTLMGERAAEFTGIANNAAAQIKTIQDDITRLSANHAQSVLNLKADFEKSRAKLDEKYQSGVIDDVLAFQDKQIEMQIDLAGKKADIEKESGKKLIDINDNYQKAISSIQERYEKARLKALIDRDARALFEAEQTRDDDLKDASNSRQESIDDEAIDHAEKLAAADEYYTEQSEKAQRAFENQQIDAAYAYQQQLDQLQVDFNERLNLEAQNYNEELLLLNGSLEAQNIMLDGAMAVLDNTYQIHYNVREQNLYNHLGRMNAMQYASLSPENIATGTLMSPAIIPTATMDYAIAQQAALDAMRAGVTSPMDAERQRVVSGGTRRYAEGGYISAPIGTPVPIIAHGGEAVIPANLVPGLAAMLGGGMRVTMSIQGDGMLAEIMRGVAYEAIIDIVQ